VLLALSAGQKTGLALVGAAFVVFALLSALVLPRFRPDFPGRGVRLFVVVTVVFFLGMLAAVIGFARESEERAAEGTTATETAGPPPPPAPAPAKGDAAAGKALFAANGCGSCHTFKPANATGKVGPDLDNLAADAKEANRGSLEQYTHESIADPNAYVVSGFPSGVMPPFSSLGPTKIDDLVAFLTQQS
jgi:mono/diheme cytochrome c family protein